MQHFSYYKQLQYLHSTDIKFLLQSCGGFSHKLSRFDAPTPSAGWRTTVLSDHTKIKQSHLFWDRTGNSRFKNRLTFHPVIDNFLCLLGRALSKPVVTKQHRDLVGVHQLPRHEGQRAKRHLFIGQWTEQEQNKRKMKQVAKCGHESRCEQ